MAIDFLDLFAFIHVARQESFSRAAASMRIAQSALSRRVARLEHQIGTDLLQRHGRGIRLTSAGAILLDRADNLVRELEEIERDVYGLAQEPTGNFLVALPPTSGQHVAPLIVSECKKLFPKINLRLREGFSGSIHEWIVRGEVDLAVLYEPEENSDLEIEHLIREPLYLIAPKGAGEANLDIPSAEKFAMSQLGTLPLILPTRSHGIRALVDRFAAEHSFVLDIAYEVDGMRTIKGMVEAGLGFTIFSYAGVYEEIRSGTLQAIPLNPSVQWHLSMVTRISKSRPHALSELQSIVRRKVQEMYKLGYWQGELVSSEADAGKK